MTHSGGKPHTNVGDKGQQFEVTYLDSKGERKIFGWADSDEATKQLCDSINLNPSMGKPLVRDRKVTNKTN